MNGIPEFVATTAGGLILIAGTVSCAAAASSACRWAPSARAAGLSAAVSPLWLLAPIVLGFLLTWLGNDEGILWRVAGIEVPVLLLLQLAVSAWIVYRYRRWPFLVIPLAVLCCLWQYELVMGAVLDGVKALALAD